MRTYLWPFSVAIIGLTLSNETVQNTCIVKIFPDDFTRRVDLEREGAARIRKIDRSEPGAFFHKTMVEQVQVLVCADYCTAIRDVITIWPNPPGTVISENPPLRNSVLEDS